MAGSKKVEKKEKLVDMQGKNKKQLHYNLKLFIAGDEPNSRIAKEILEELCKKYLHSNYQLEIIDVIKDFKSALEEKVFFAPTLIIETSQFKSRIVGSLNDIEKILDILGLSKTSRNK